MLPLHHLNHSIHVHQIKSVQINHEYPGTVEGIHSTCGPLDIPKTISSRGINSPNDEFEYKLCCRDNWEDNHNSPGSLIRFVDLEDVKAHRDLRTGEVSFQRTLEKILYHLIAFPAYF